MNTPDLLSLTLSLLTISLAKGIYHFHITPPQRRTTIFHADPNFTSCGDPNTVCPRSTECGTWANNPNLCCQALSPFSPANCSLFSPLVEKFNLKPDGIVVNMTGPSGECGFGLRKIGFPEWGVEKEEDVRYSCCPVGFDVVVVREEYEMSEAVGFRCVDGDYAGNTGNGAWCGEDASTRSATAPSSPGTGMSTDTDTGTGTSMRKSIGTVMAPSKTLATESRTWMAVTPSSVASSISVTAISTESAGGGGIEDDGGGGGGKDSEMNGAAADAGRVRRDFALVMVLFVGIWAF
ncbi:hypothetical protein ABW19_dt0200683 [Dactylella cylindrospora]|nr:hypothetical protein ABW19_dt0200683 [Dactylella cylindrospora]